MEKIIKELKLARGILFREDEVLLVQDIRPGQLHYFLPGGSVEPGESVTVALAREWKEELGWDIKAGSFFGCLESTWMEKRKSDGARVEVCEMNYLFEAVAGPEYFDMEPASLESHLRFAWISLSDLKKIDLLPEPLAGILTEVHEKKPRSIWRSTL